MSPLLFNLVVETLPLLVFQFEKRHWLPGFRILGVSESTTVLQYTDDTSLFLRLSNGLHGRLRKCLLIISLISRLKINLTKSYLYGVDMDEEVVKLLPPH